MRKALFAALRVAVAAGILLYLWSAGRLDFAVLGGALRRWPCLAAAAGCYTAVAFVGAARWRLVLASTGTRLPYPVALRLTYIGHISNYALPGVVGGDAVKAVVAARHASLARTLTATLADRVIGSIVMAAIPLFAGAALALPPGLEAARLLLGAFLLAALTAALLWRYVDRPLRRLAMRLPKRRLLLRAIASASAVRAHARATAGAGALSLAAHALSILAFWLLLRAGVGCDVGWLFIVFCVPVGLLLEALPISIAGVGVGEGAFEWLLTGACAAGAGAGAALVMHVLKPVCALPGLVFLLAGSRYNRKDATPSEKIE